MGNIDELKGTYVDFVHGIKNAVQAEIAKIDDFVNGAVRILIVPKCHEADEWLGGLGMDCERDFVFPATPGGSHTRPNGWRGDDDGECDCSGYAALKIQGAA
ncbi:MAG: hypothetical protein LBL84_01320, partial [Candidatus Nomurabacteria bacterium]|nr:hypothetical protein [Candidatus Nomurabacteria bacterium]